MATDVEAPGATYRNRLLVVDDDRDTLDSLEPLLRHALPGVQILTTSRPAEALELVRTRRIDAILTDERLPGMTGRELIAECVQVQPRLAALLMSAYPDLEMVVGAAQTINVQGVVNKPIDMPLLTARLKRVLDLVAEGKRNTRRTDSR